METKKKTGHVRKAGSDYVCCYAINGDWKKEKNFTTRKEARDFLRK
jgi:hypothetical protein